MARSAASIRRRPDTWFVAGLVVFTLAFTGFAGWIGPAPSHLLLDRPIDDRSMYRWIVQPAAVERSDLSLPIAAGSLAQRWPDLDSRARLAINSAGEIRTLFTVLGYDVTEVRETGAPVPRLDVAALPADIDTLEDADHRKTVFIGLVLPLILKVNEAITAERERMLSLKDAIQAGQRIRFDDRVWLWRLAARYGLDTPDLGRLQRRIDIIPPSLALAQGALESGWGTSRFAIEGNALFGERTWNDEGLAPMAETAQSGFTVRAFPAMKQSIAAYIHNLNTHDAYRDLRTRRAEARVGGNAPGGSDLAAGLEQYSEKGSDYIELVRAVIRSESMTAFDDAVLDPVTVEAPGAGWEVRPSSGAGGGKSVPWFDQIARDTTF